MGEFVEFHTKVDGLPYAVKPHYILVYYPLAGNCVLALMGVGQILVAESYTAVKEILANHTLGFTPYE